MPPCFTGTLSRSRIASTICCGLRAQQDQSHGFQCLIPLAFYPEKTQLSHLPGPSGVDSLKTMAVSRLLLDNFDHVKAYWVMLGKRLAQVALHYGANDIDGTITEGGELSESYSIESNNEVKMSRSELVSFDRRCRLRSRRTRYCLQPHRAK